MSLDLRQVLPQVESLGQEAARRAAAASIRLPRLAQLLLDAARLDRSELEHRLAAAPATAHPAWPTDEAIDASFPLPAHPPRLRLLAADGSQVYPDRHAAAFFYMVNIGSIDLLQGSGRPPQTATHSNLHFDDEDLRDTRGLPVDTHLINARRDAAELKELARLVEGPVLSEVEGPVLSEVEGPVLSEVEGPTLALLDNGLLLWAASQEQKAARPDVQRVLDEYLAALDVLRDSGAALAGYISRPRGANVVDLVEAAAAEAGGTPPRLTDRLLFGRHLQAHMRSARFRHPARINDEFAARGHEIQFFYLHTGAQDGIARVEIPHWVAADAARMAMVHAGIVEQCRLTGVPYPLVRAHELALVGQDDRRALDGLVQAALIRHGISGLASQKAQTKRWTGRRRRHQL
ncbi:MAG TPA: DNA double-strand break repair nuclease NurA [Anaerolineales bacterium]|nr:DNA double-strand break repair nuclease NurA [Anaerolineales bacterium]